MSKIIELLKTIFPLLKREAWNFLRDRATGHSHVEITRLGLFAGLASLILFTGWVLFSTGVFDADKFAQAFAWITGGGGGALAMKSAVQTRGQNGGE